MSIGKVVGNVVRTLLIWHDRHHWLRLGTYLTVLPPESVSLFRYP